MLVKVSKNGVDDAGLINNHFGNEDDGLLVRLVLIILTIGNKDGG